jgi:hypothetical protein
MIKTSDREMVEAYMAAMQSGPAGLERLVELFGDEAVYVEAFGGQPHVHAGKDEIRSFFDVALRQHLNAARLTLDRLDLDGERLRSEWTCTLPMLSAPLRGFDLVTLRDGLIVRLETIVTESPPLPNA